MKKLYISPQCLGTPEIYRAKALNDMVQDSGNSVKRVEIWGTKNRMGTGFGSALASLLEGWQKLDRSIISEELPNKEWYRQGRDIDG
jgi:hypothetical protein